ncbi:MAG: hypothetical protein F6J90_21385 [Moorea sp. SIOASIH]|nr:hypothetical protein [Moorena sp. SIOASIH]
MVRLLPPMPPVVFARFDNPADALGYVQALKALMPGAKFLIFFCSRSVTFGQSGSSCVEQA